MVLMSKICKSGVELCSLLLGYEHNPTPDPHK